MTSEDKSGKFGSNFPPINLIFLDTQLKHAGHKVCITTENYSIKAVSDIIRDFQPDVIGITFMTLGFPNLASFVEMIFEVAPDISIVTGGYHSTLFPEAVLKISDQIKAVFIGEAERSIVDFAEVLGGDSELTNEILAGIKGIAYLDGEEMIKTPPLPAPLNELDELPFPDFDLIDEYFEQFHGGLNRHFLGGVLHAFLLTGRGCPCSCHFCDRMILGGQKIRQNSIDYKIELISTINKKNME